MMSAKENDRIDLDKRVFAAVQKFPALHTVAYAELSNEEYSKVYSSLQRLVKEGKLERYKCPDTAKIDGISSNSVYYNLPEDP